MFFFGYFVCLLRSGSFLDWKKSLIHHTSHHFTNGDARRRVPNNISSNHRLKKRTMSERHLITSSSVVTSP